MKFKMSAIFVAVAMMASMLSGCGNALQEKESVAANESSTVAEKENDTTETIATEEVYVPTYPLVKDGEEVTVKGVLFSDSIDPKDTERIVFQKWEEISGVNIDIEIISKSAMNTYLASGNWPDFFMYCFEDNIVEDYGVIGGRFVNLLDYLDIMPNLAATFEEFPESKKGFVWYNGEMYEFPKISKVVTNVNPRAYIRTDLLEEYGLEIPTTVEDFKNVLSVLKEKTEKVQWIPKNNQKNNFEIMLFAAFGEYVNLTFEAEDDGTVTFVPATEQMKRYYTYMNDLYEEELIHQEMFSIDSKLATSLEQEGGMFVLEYAANSMQQDMFKDSDWSYFTICPPLTSEYDSTQEIVNSSYVSRSLIAPYIVAESEHVELLCKLFDMMYTDEEVVEGTGFSGNTFANGIEGVHWKINEDGVTFEQLVPEGYAGSFNEFALAELTFSGMGKATALDQKITSTPGNGQVRQTAFAEHVWPYVSEEDPFPTNLLRFNEDEQYAINQKWAELDSYVTEMRAKFISGLEDIETGWDTYLKTLDNMGLQDILKAYQSAYDRWCSY